MPLLPLVLYLLFTLLSTVGAGLIGAHFGGRRAGLVAALTTLAFFAALAAGMWVMLGRYAGLPGEPQPVSFGACAPADDGSMPASSPWRRFSSPGSPG